MKSAKNSKSAAPGRRREGWPARETLDEFLKAVSGVIPLLDSVKDSLEESTGSIPKASKQLDNVTRATETATVEILDLLEHMTARVDSLGKSLAVVRAAAEEGKTRVAALDRLMESLNDSHPEVLERWKEFRGIIVGAVLPADFDVRFAALHDDVMSVGMALQVQDITSQQIAGVSHMIESIRKNLAEVLQNFSDAGRTDPGRVPVSRLEKVDPNGHFNGDAEYSRTADRQEDADEIVARWKRGNHG